MVRVLGNSPERIKITDLNDVIYYRQQKEYTDQEFEGSRDLKKEIEKGRVTIIDKYQTVKNAPTATPEPVVVKHVTPQSISQEDIKKAVSEVLAGFNKPSINALEIKQVVSDAMKLGQQPAAETVSSQDIRKIILEVMQDYKLDNKVEPVDIRKIITEVLSENIPATQEIQTIDPQDIKRVVAEVIAENKPENSSDMGTMLMSMIPLIADAVRQEVARIQIVASHAVPQKTTSSFIGPEYIPDINLDGMKSNVKGEERTQSGGSVSSSLDALKRLKKST